MEGNADPEHGLMTGESYQQNMQIDPSRARFPCCIVWSPLPVISWLVPFIGHIGICREDGVILDFAGPNFVCVDSFAFGSATCYIQVNKEQVISSSEVALLPIYMLKLLQLSAGYLQADGLYKCGRFCHHQTNRELWKLIMFLFLQ